jgi:hypothetical protein
MKKTLFVICISLFSVAAACDPDFKYTDNSRLVVEAVLLDMNGKPLANKTVFLSYNSGFNKLAEAVSDQNGSIFLSSPQANYGIDLYIEGYKIQSTQFYKNLTIKTGSTSSSVGVLPQSYYNFGNIYLTVLN